MVIIYYIYTHIMIKKKRRHTCGCEKCRLMGYMGWWSGWFCSLTLEVLKLPLPPEMHDIVYMYIYIHHEINYIPLNWCRILSKNSNAFPRSPKMRVMAERRKRKCRRYFVTWVFFFAERTLTGIQALSWGLPIWYIMVQGKKDRYALPL